MGDRMTRIQKPWKGASFKAQSLTSVMDPDSSGISPVMAIPHLWIYGPFNKQAFSSTTVVESPDTGLAVTIFNSIFVFPAL